MTTPAPEPDQPDQSPAAAPAAGNPASAGADTADPVTAPRRVDRRALVLASVLLLIGAGVLWGATRMTWASALAGDPKALPTNHDVSGGTWSSWLVAVALVFVAAVAATWALRGWALRIAAFVVAALAIVALLPSLSLLTNDAPAAYVIKVLDLPATQHVAAISKHSAGAVVAIIGALLGAAGAVFMLRAANRAAPMSSKYRSPAARRAELEEKVFADRAATAQPDAAPRKPTNKDTERELWDSLDLGADPTDTQ